MTTRRSFLASVPLLAVAVKLQAESAHERLHAKIRAASIAQYKRFLRNTDATVSLYSECCPECWGMYLVHEDRWRVPEKRPLGLDAYVGYQLIHLRAQE